MSYSINTLAEAMLTAFYQKRLGGLACAVSLVRLEGECGGSRSIKSVKLMAAVTALIIAATPAFAAKWIHVSTGSNNTIYYFDAETFQRSGNQVTVWIKWDHSFDMTSKKRETKSRARFDCGKRTVFIIAQTLKYSDGTREVLNIPTYVQDMGPIPSGTKMEATLNAVCRVSTRE